MALTVRFKSLLDEKLNILSEATGLSKQQMIEEATNEYVDELLRDGDVRDKIRQITERYGQLLE